MYKVLIADDEIEVREGLKLKVDWEQAGFRIAGEAANGIEAAEKLKAESYDLLITDMNMPVMDGVGLLDCCRENNPALRIIIVTGYEDFQYARAGVRNKAMDYLLKPVTRSDLRQSLLRIREELDHDYETRKQSELMGWRLSQYYKEMKERFLLDLARGSRFPSSSVSERLRLFDLSDWQEHPVCFMAAWVSGTVQNGSMNREPVKLLLPFELLCREISSAYENNVLCFHDPSYPGMMHFIIKDGFQAEMAEQLSIQAMNVLGVKAAVSMGRTVSGLAYWKDGYIQSWMAWNMSGSGEPEEVVMLDERSSHMPEETIQVLHRCLIRGELASFRTLIRGELEQAGAVSSSRLVRTLLRISLIIESAAAETSRQISRKDKLWARPEWLLWLETPQQAEEFLMEWALRFQASSLPSGIPEETLIESAKRYIEDNYMHDLTLTSMAEQYNYHSTYFSEMFKAGAGVSFIQYLTEVRMKHAVRLLKETSLSLWDIAELTGFSSPGYFSSKFKKMYGMSPSDFRNGLSSEKITHHHPKK